MTAAAWITLPAIVALAGALAGRQALARAASPLKHSDEDLELHGAPTTIQTCRGLMYTIVVSVTIGLGMPSDIGLAATDRPEYAIIALIFLSAAGGTFKKLRSETRPITRNSRAIQVAKTMHDPHYRHRIEQLRQRRTEGHGPRVSKPTRWPSPEPPSTPKPSPR